jgi:class 3 adenylate cyclase/tetratricopeptide (TPR) repeat protein
MAHALRSVRTVLFTDIVGSTERAAALGDTEWGRVLEAHHSLVRRALRRNGGQEANTAGDGFLATFEQPAAAIRCAWTVATEIRSLDLEVRSGIHTGEIEGHGRDLKGLGVHIGSRIASLAGPGEVLVTRTTRELVTGAGFEFEDRGEQRLKGMPEEWRVYRVSGVPATQLTGQKTPTLSRVSRHGKVLGVVGGVVTIAVLAGLWIRHSREVPGPVLEAAPGIAILPFRAGIGLEKWREGMVDLLSANLDGAGGLRAIDSRTTLARWREGATQGTDPDLETSLGIAERTGASYAVLGSAVEIGGELRLAAQMYDLEDGSVLGTAQVAGPPDSLTSLVDRLSIEILRAILAEEGRDVGPRPHLASVTTSSLPALKAYLEGETLYRRGAFSEAVSAYDAATSMDTTFALAYYRKAVACGMDIRCFGTEPNFVAISATLRNIDRLSERESIQVRGLHYFMHSNPYLAVEILGSGIRKYPDDPELWYGLADTYFHYGNQILSQEADSWKQLMERAVQLDPWFPSAMSHLYWEAFFRRDSSEMAAWVEKWSSAVPDKDAGEGGRLAFALAFGGDNARDSILAGIDTLRTDLLVETAVFLAHPRDWPASEVLLREAVNREDVGAIAPVFHAFRLFGMGKLDAALQALDGDRHEGPRDVASMMEWRIQAGERAVPDSVFEDALASSAADTVSWLVAGAHAADRSRWTEHSAAVHRIEEAARAMTARGDSVRSRILNGGARALRGYGAWRSGDREEAWTTLEGARRDVVVVDFDRLWSWNEIVRLWLAHLSMELDRPEDSVRYFKSLWQLDPYSVYEVARAEEKLGREAEAIVAYEYVVAALHDADPELKPRFEAARRAITRLSGAAD